MLPEPRNTVENYFLDIIPLSECFFLGLTQVDDGLWWWNSDGSEVKWNKWLSREQHGVENCAVMYRDAPNEAHKDRWVFYPCDPSRERPVVCERRTRKYNIDHE